MLYQRLAGDWGFVVLNKLKANNFRQLFSDIESFQVDDGLLMYSTHSGKRIVVVYFKILMKFQGVVYGIWIYSESDKEQFVAWFEQIVNGPSRTASPMVAVCVPRDNDDDSYQSQTSTPLANNKNIRDMLLQAARKNSHDVPPKQGPKILQELFASAISSPVKQPNSIPPINNHHSTSVSSDNALDKMVRFAVQRYPTLTPHSFKDIVSDLIAQDDQFWVGLYQSYLQQIKSKHHS